MTTLAQRQRPDWPVLPAEGGLRPSARDGWRVARWVLLAWVGFNTGNVAMASEEPKFELLTQDGDFEIRRYSALIVAETMVEGDMDAATRQGFKRIADYIFGNNQAARPVGDPQPSAKIAMTAPVVAEPVGSGRKIAMTAPVTAEPVGGAVSMALAQQWRIHFVMPSAYTLTNLPTPRNSAVQLRALPPQAFAVLKYSGSNSAERVQEKTDELLRWLALRHLQPAGAPQLARYDPPWTLPMWRRNEIQIRIENP